MGNTIANKSRPPMKIHNLHGKNLRVTENRLMATRNEGYADAMFFGSRTVDREEIMELTITKMTVNWNGSLRFGFTTHDPVAICNHPEGIPRFMCPDLVKRGGSFIETLNHIKLRVGDQIRFWVNAGGEVQVKVNDVQQRPQSTKNITQEVWPVVDVYGNCVEVKFRSLKDNVTRNDGLVEPHVYTTLSLTRFLLAANTNSIELSSNRDLIKRKTIGKAYAWNASPLLVNTVWALFVKEVDYTTSRNLSIAVLTSAPPGTISSALPELMEGFSRCAVFNNVYVRMIVGDEFAVCITDAGVVMIAINGDNFESLGNVPKSANYWIIANMNCDILSLVSLGVHQMTKFLLPKLPPITETFAARQMSTTSLLSGASGGGGSNASFDSVPESPQPAVAVVMHPNIVTPPNYDAECVICLNNVPDSVFIPCGHINCCKACADNLMNEHGNLICPTCRNRIEDNIKVSF